MRIGVIGINHKQANLKLRELLAHACARRFHPRSLLNNSLSYVLLSTCNRTELYFHSDEMNETHSYLLNILREELSETFDQKLYSYFGIDCFSHLCRVTTGLDSAIIAETEIQGQVKKSYEAHLASSLLPTEIHFLFQNALKIGKRIRQQVLNCRGMLDIEHAVFQAGDLHLCPLPEKNILFVGASEINKKVMHYLVQKKASTLTLCNRSPDRAQEVANKYPINLLPWEDLSTWHHYDMVILGTKCPSHLISKEHLPKNLQSTLLIDLCVPRNVDPTLAAHPSITLLNIDQINQTLRAKQKQIQALVYQAEEMITDSTERHINLFSLKQKKRAVLLCSG